MHLPIGRKIQLCLSAILLIVLSCTTSKQSSSISDRIGKGDFKSRLEHYKSEVKKLVKTQMGKKLKPSDSLIYFSYTGFDNSKITCNAIIKLSLEEVLEATSFSVNSSCTFVLDEMGKYKSVIWHNGVNIMPQNMNSFDKEKQIINEYLESQFELMFQYSNCEFGDYIFGYKPNSELRVFKVIGNNLESISWNNI